MLDATIPLHQRLRFLIEIDRLKGIQRRSYVLGGERLENSAEHSWHVATMALVLQEYAAEPIDSGKVICMMLLHDIVEIDADDTFCYDTEGHRDKAEREQAAASRLFGLLPVDQKAYFRALWDEFEARQTAESRFAAGLDRLMPLIHNYLTEGRTWHEHGVTAEQVLAHNRHMAEGSPALWEFASGMIKDAVAKGYLAPAPSA